MAGWLYVMSGLILALLLIAAVTPPRSLRGLTLKRQPIQPVSAGDSLHLELTLTNQTNQPKALLQVQDHVPYVLGTPIKTAIEQIAAHQTYRWIYDQPTVRRGIYRWQTVQLRTAAPLGLFWCRRSQTAPAIAIVYPTVLPLTRCPLVDEMGQDVSQQLLSDRRSQTATEGLTRALRPYRWGDSIRLIHWRTSARYGELRVRELERFTSGQEFAVALDTAADWDPETFEQAVIAAASLYFYALRQGLQPWLWTASTGLIRGDRPILETLAGTQFGEVAPSVSLPKMSLTWLTQNGQSLNTLPAGSRWLLWAIASGQSQGPSSQLTPGSPGLIVQPDQPLQPQLQSSLSR